MDDCDKNPGTDFIAFNICNFSMYDQNGDKMQEVGIVNRHQISRYINGMTHLYIVSN